MFTFNELYDKMFLKFEQGVVFMNNTDKKKLVGMRIKELRTEKQLTQEALAELLPGVSGKSSIANYENGSNFPSDEVKLKLCEIFNCTLDYLMCNSDIRNLESIEIDNDKIKIGLSTNDYENITDEQKKQIEEFAKYVLKDNKKDKK